MKTLFSTLLLTSVLTLGTLQVQAAITNDSDNRVDAVAQEKINITETGLAVVEPGSLSSAQVRTMQLHLSGQGNFTGNYYEGSIDGKWGPKTAAAVERFQRDHGLWADGLLTTSTIAQLGLDIDSMDSSYTGITPAAGDESRTPTNDSNSVDDSSSTNAPDPVDDSTNVPNSMDDFKPDDPGQGIGGPY